MTDKTLEKQFQGQIELKKQKGLAKLGVKTSHTWYIDPKRLLFSLSRYKFVAKMLDGKNKVLEIGCGDAFCSRIVRQAVKHLTVTDIDPLFIEDALERDDEKWNMEYKVLNILEESFDEEFDAAYSLDVIEHIPPEQTNVYIQNIARSLNKTGVFIVGTPSLNSQAYASENSKIGHINCMNAPELKENLMKYFNNVFIFSMNDEVVHTGYYPMAHYLFALCTDKK